VINWSYTCKLRLQSQAVACQVVGKVTESYPKAAEGKACFNHFSLKAEAGSRRAKTEATEARQHSEFY